MKLLIRNLARATTEKELRLLFEAYGTVQSCTLVTDKATGLSKGFGFVEMSGPGETRAAMKKLNGNTVAGNRIRVKETQQKPASNSGNKGKQQADSPKKN
jgi:RNA recognition motif-containing protein